MADSVGSSATATVCCQAEGVGCDWEGPDEARAAHEEGCAYVAHINECVRSGTIEALIQQFDEDGDGDVSWAEVEAVATAAELSLEERTAFSHNMWRIKQEQLGVVVDKLVRMCPAAIEKDSDDEIEINIDKIDARTLRELDGYMRECLSNK